MRKSILILCILIKFVFSSMVRYTICCKNTKFSWIKCKIIFFSAYKSKNGRQYQNGHLPEWGVLMAGFESSFRASHFMILFVLFWASTLPTWGKHVTQHGQARCPKWADFISCLCPKVYHESVIRPFIVFFNYCLQSFVFYKASFVCF